MPRKKTFFLIEDSQFSWSRLMQYASTETHNARLKHALPRPEQATPLIPFACHPARDVANLPLRLPGHSPSQFGLIDKNVQACEAIFKVGGKIAVFSMGNDRFVVSSFAYTPAATIAEYSIYFWLLLPCLNSLSTSGATAMSKVLLFIIRT